MEMEMQDEACKGCSASVHVPDAQIDRMVAALKASPAFDGVPDEVYKARLAACMNCPSLSHGHTCMHCGCIVRVRALLRDRKCPLPGKPRW